METPVHFVLPCGRTAIVDAVDWEMVSVHSWYSVRRGGHDHNEVDRYVRATIEGKQLTLHRFLMNPPEGLEVDHRSGDGLDNRRDNLRICTRLQNMQNSRLRKKPGPTPSKYIGVWWHKNRQKWYAAISVPGGKQKHVGVFASEEEAALARDEAAKIYHGEFARLNFDVQPARRTA